MQKVYDRDHIRDDIQREFASNAVFEMRSNLYGSMRRAAEGAGFRFEGVMRGFWPVTHGDPRDYALYGRTRTDHEAGEG